MSVPAPREKQTTDVSSAAGLTGVEMVRPSLGGCWRAMEKVCPNMLCPPGGRFRAMDRSACPGPVLRPLDFVSALLQNISNKYV